MKILIFFLILSPFILSSCFETCPDIVEKYFRDSCYNFKLNKKYTETRFNIFEGKDKNERNQNFTVVGFQTLFDSASIGDTIKKYKGHTEMILIRKNRDSIIFPCYCNGRIYE